MAEASDTSVTVKLNNSLQVNNESHTDEIQEEQNGKAYYPTMIAESTPHHIPENLHNIVSNLDETGDGSSTNKYDLFVSVLYVLMVEMGFVPRNLPLSAVPSTWCNSISFHKERLQLLDVIPSKWKNPKINMYHIDFILIPIPNRVCKMICQVINQNLNVNIIVDKECNVSAQFRVTKYVTSEMSKTVSMKFRHLDELSKNFKDLVANVAKQTILVAEGLDSASLSDLAPEVLYKIFLYLSPKDFLNLTSTCHRFKSCSMYFANNIWKHYFARDFPTATGLVGGKDVWSERYKEEYLKRSRPPRFKPLTYYDYDFMDLI